MNIDGFVNVASAIVTVALVTTIVSHKGSGEVIKQLGGAFRGSLLAAQGK